MNIIDSGGKFQIYGDSITTYDALPVGSYEVCFNQFTGFSLQVCNDLNAREEKIYGNHLARIDKVFRTFDITDRNLGIILSGEKGSGKTLFARLLAQKANEKELPVIIVKAAYPGIADYLSSIKQTVVVIFDEFEKTFRGDGDYIDPQEDLLTLFDGLDDGKKLFVITCNDPDELNHYFINRPGRFHYHFIVKCPTPLEITEYLHDKLQPQYYDNINRIITLSIAVDLTYDFLRAIAFELNMGNSLEETLEDMNIVLDHHRYFDAVIKFTNGDTYNVENIAMNFMNPRSHVYTGESLGDAPSTSFTLSSKNIKYENENIIIPPNCIHFHVDEIAKMLANNGVDKPIAERQIESCILTKREVGNGYEFNPTMTI